jgi:hypothetical protein
MILDDETQNAKIIPNQSQPLTAKAMAEVQGRSGQGQDALRGGLDELVQVQ